MTGKSLNLASSAAIVGTLMCILLGGNAFGVIVTFPSAIWGHNPVHYYEVQNSVGQTRVIGSPLAAGDQFLMQFDSLDALLNWKGGGGPAILSTDYPRGSVTGITSLFTVERPLTRREIANKAGYFNLRRAFSVPEIASVVDFVLPPGMAWMERMSGVSTPPLSITNVTGENIFGRADSDEKTAQKRGTFIRHILDPNEVAERLDLAGSPEPTILIIILAVLAMIVIAVLRVNFQLRR